MNEKRSSVRYKMYDYPVFISDNQKDWGSASLVNVSGTGAKIKCECYYPFNSLFIEMPRQLSRVLGNSVLKCEVMWSKYSEINDGSCEYGLKFERILAEDMVEEESVLQST